MRDISINRARSVFAKASVLLLALAVVSGCSGSGRILEPRLGDEPASDALEVVDTGFSRVGDDDAWLTVGVTVRNPTKFMAIESRLKVSLVDGEGEAVMESVIDETIYVLRPGEETGYGFTETSLEGWPDDIEKVVVETIETEQWTASKSESAQLLTISVTDVEFGKWNDNLDEIRLVAKAEGPGIARHVNYAAIFYDSEKNLVGGCGEPSVMGFDRRDGTPVTLACIIPDGVDHDDIELYNDYS